MIREIPAIIKQDAIQVMNWARGNIPRNKEQNERVCLAALRIFTAIGIAVSFVHGISSLTMLASTPVAAIFAALGGAAGFVVCHDCFVIAYNQTKQMNPVNQVVDGLKAGYLNIKMIGKQALMGEDGEVPHLPLTEGTYLRGFWTDILLKVGNTPEE